jgi:hypothetical protein
MSLTPCDLEVLLHYYVSPYELDLEHTEHPRLHAPAVEASISMFVNQGLMARRAVQSKYGSSYDVTEMGGAFVQMLCTTPFPVQRYEDPRNLITASTQQG